MLKSLWKLFQTTQEWDGSEKREVHRCRAEFEVELALPKLRYLGMCMDISPKGMRMRIRGPYKPGLLKPGTICEIKYLGTPVNVDVERIQGVLRWTKKETESQFQAALQFQDAPTKLEKSWLKPILREHFRGKPVRQRRHTVRVSCGLPCQFVSDSKTYDGTITDLSMGGMLIESFSAVMEGSSVTVRFGPHAPLGRVVTNGTIVSARRPLGTFAYGVRCHAMDTETKQAILAYIKHFHKRRKT